MAGRLLQQAVESCLFEVVVGRQCSPERQPSHHRKARAVYEAELLVGAAEKQLPTLLIDCFIDMNYFDPWGRSDSVAYRHPKLPMNPHRTHQ